MEKSKREILELLDLPYMDIFTEDLDDTFVHVVCVRWLFVARVFVCDCSRAIFC